MPDTDPTPTPADLDAFDVDAFIAGITRPTETVPLVQDANLGKQLRQAQLEVTAAIDDQANAKAEGRASKRRAGSTETPAVENARARYDALLEHARATGRLVYIHVETATEADRRQALVDARADGGSMSTYNTSLISLTCRLHLEDPRANPNSKGRVLTVEQWTAINNAVGALQWDAIVEASSRVAEDAVTPDFSLPASLSPDGGTSSGS